jgi:hypothetical protein
VAPGLRRAVVICKIHQPSFRAERSNPSRNASKAIQRATLPKLSSAQRFQVGLLRRFAPRNDVEEKSAVIMRMNDAPVCGISLRYPP